MLPPVPQDSDDHQEVNGPPSSTQPPSSSLHSSQPSHVPVDFFDPTGVHELHRTFTRHYPANTINPTKPLGTPPDEFESRSSASTVIGEDDFNFAKHLKDIIKR